MIDSDIIVLAETEVDKLIMVCHRQGLNYWQILKIFLDRCQILQMRADAEYYLKRGE